MRRNWGNYSHIFHYKLLKYSGELRKADGKVKLRNSLGHLVLLLSTTSALTAIITD